MGSQNKIANTGIIDKIRHLFNLKNISSEEIAQEMIKAMDNDEELVEFLKKKRLLKYGRNLH